MGSLISFFSFFWGGGGSLNYDRKGTDCVRSLCFSVFTNPCYSVCNQLGILYTVVKNFVVSSVFSGLHAGDRGLIPSWDRPYSLK